MNRNKLYILCLSALAMFACSDSPEDFANKAYINADAKRTTYLIQPDSPTYSDKLSVSVARPAEKDITVTFKADQALLSLYNNTFSDNAVILPAENYTLSDAKATIARESVRSTEATIDFKDINLLDNDKVYVLPVTISDAGIEILESARTHYYIFRQGALINWAADIEANNFPISWGNSSLVSSMTNLTIEGLLYLRQAEREGSESNIMTFFGVENKFLIRLGDTFDAGQIMIVVNNGKYPDNANDRTSAPVGRWFHMAVTLDSTGALKLYIDGQLKSTTNIGANTVNISSGCYIGKSYSEQRWWPGMICETRLWNVARTQEEIADNIYYINPGTEGMVAYWKFDEGNGNTIADHTENGSTITSASALKWTSVSLPEE